MRFNKAELPENWNTYSLSEVCKNITSGGTPSRSNPKFYKNGNICWVKTKELNNTYLFDTEEKITSEALNNSSAKLLPANTILLAMYGATVGELGILAKEMSCNQACCALITNPEIVNFKYIYYLLKLYKEEIKSLATGAAQQNLSAKTIKEFEFDFPSLENQNKFVSILGVLDEKIQLNTQINQTLEQIAQAIFKSWFIDFDPVRAKADALAQGKSPQQADRMAMEIISGKTQAELDRLQTENPTDYQQLLTTAQTFPSEFEEVEGFGNVPKGWEVIKVGNIIKFIKGKKPKEILNQQESNYLPHLLISSLSGKYSEFAEISNNVVISETQDTIMVMDGASSGKVYIGHNGVIGSTLAKLDLKDKKCWAVLYYFIKTKEIEICSNTTGTSIPHTDKSKVENYEMVIPKDNIIGVWNEICENILTYTLNNLNETLTLEKTRDLLLPKLLNGEIEL